MSVDVDGTERSPTEPIRFRFRIFHLFYVTALIASALATFGVGGLYPAVVLSVGWTCVFVSTSRPKALALFVTVAVFGCCLCVPGGLRGIPQGAARRMYCSHNLKQIALALHNYHDVYQTLPPAIISDADGKPMHSWRVLILPFLEERPLYDSYDFDEPWDGPNNSQLANQMPHVYGCPSHALSNRTSYAAVTGEHTMWTGDERGIKFQDVVDGTSNTLLVLEAEPRQLNWMEPRDISFEEAAELLTSRNPKHLESGHKDRDFFYERWTGRNLALADGSVRFLPHAVSRGAVSAMLLRDDGAEVKFDELDSESRPVARLRVDNCFRLALFIIIALFPLPWVWRKPLAGNEAG